MRNLLNRLYRKWLGVGKVLNEVTLAITFLSFIPTAVFTLYYLFWDFDFCRVIAGALVLRVMVKSNVDI